MLVTKQTSRSVNQRKPVNKVTTVTTVAKATKKRQKKARGAKVSSKRGLGPCTSEYVKSLLNPWDYGACIPDGTEGTMQFSARQTLTLSTGTGGGACSLALVGDPYNFYVADNTNTAATTFTYNTGTLYTSAAAVATIVSMGSSYRIVSMGLKAWYVGSTQNDQGVIVAAQINPGGTAKTLTGLLNSSTADQVYNNSQYSEVAALREGIEIVWRPPSVSTGTLWGSMQTGASTAGTFGLSLPFIFVGVSSAQALFSTVRMEMVVNYELLITNQSALGGIHSPAPPAEIGWFENAMNAVRDVPNIATTVSSTIGSAIENYPRTAYATAHMAYNYLRGPASGQRLIPYRGGLFS